MGIVSYVGFFVDRSVQSWCHSIGLNEPSQVNLGAEEVKEGAKQPKQAERSLSGAKIFG